MPGQQAQFDQHRIQPPQDAALSGSDWGRQRLVFNDAPLIDVVERLNQYHSGLISLRGDIRLQQLRVQQASHYL